MRVNLSSGFPPRVDTNRLVQTQKMARRLETLDLENRENLHSVGVQTAERHRWRLDVNKQRPVTLVIAMFFLCQIFANSIDPSFGLFIL